MDELRFAAACKRPEIIITTANIGFIVTRLMLFMVNSTMARKASLTRPTHGFSPFDRSTLCWSNLVTK